MTIYNYDFETLEYTYSKEALRGVKGEFLIPDFSTNLKPPKVKENFAIIFNKQIQKWEYVEDNRDKTIYNKNTKEEIKVDYLGELKPKHTFLKPNEFDIWDQNTSSWLTPNKDTRENQEELEKLKEYLKDTDFYYVRLAETSKPVPVEVITKRTQARERIRELLTKSALHKEDNLKIEDVSLISK